jgi:hypothetical protein
MNRRNLLISIGTAAVGSGAVLGSGALTSVEATRTANVGVDNDSSAYLGLSATGNVSEVTNGGGDELDISLPDNLNDEAVTTFGTIDSNPAVTTAAFTVTNNSDATDNGQSLSMSASTPSGEPDILNLKTVVSGNIVDITSSSISLSAGSSQNFIVEVDTDDGTDYSGDGLVTQVTFTAE